MRRLLLIVAGLAFAVFLAWRWELGMIRYFDVDEFAYLHWARQFSTGSTPYLDFFFYIPPGFLWILAPLFWIGQGVGPVLAARGLAWGIFAGLCGAIGILLYMQRAKKGEYWLAFLPGIILAFLPLPLDKFLEIRPDTLATLLVVLGMIFQLRKQWLPAGFWYGVSLVILPKSLPFVAVGALLGPRVLPGMMLPLGAFGAWLLSLGQWDTVFYSLASLPFETSKIAKTFIMQPDLFFYPNTTYYGTAGWSRELVANHTVWLIGLGVGIYRFFTKWDEWLISGALIISVISFIYLYPLRHAQYLIPVAVFVAFYAADAIVLLWQKVHKNNLGQKVFFVGFIAMIVGMFIVYTSGNSPKLAWTNTETLTEMRALWEYIPKDAYVLDLDGRTLYFKDPYYVCCLPFGQYEPYLSRPLLSLSQALEEKNVQYIYEGQLGRVNTLSVADQAYIREHYQIDSVIPGLLTRQ